MASNHHSINIPECLIKLNEEFTIPKKIPNIWKYHKSKKKDMLVKRDGVDLTVNKTDDVLKNLLCNMGFINEQTENKRIKLVIDDENTDIIYTCGLNMTIADLILCFYIFQVIDKMSCLCYVSEFLKKLKHIHKWLILCISKPHVLKAIQSTLKTTLLKPCSGCQGDQEYFNIEEFVQEKTYISFHEKAPNPKQMHLRISNKLPSIRSKLTHGDIEPCVSSCEQGIVILDWNNMPDEINPTQGDLNVGRSLRKRQQIENMVTYITSLLKAGDKVVDFCSGGGHLGIVIAYLRKDCKVTLVENKEESINKALSRIQRLNLANISVQLSNLDYYTGAFDMGVSLHACGSATDLVLERCIEKKASFVICPCCYGSIRPTDNIKYPKSDLFSSCINEEEYYLLAHSADRTSTDYESTFNKEGKKSMVLTDFDRILHAKLHGYDVTNIYSMIPLDCSPKNNIIVGKIS